MNRTNDNGILIVKRNLSIVLCVIAAASVLSGCGYMRSKFGTKPDRYKNSEQGRPLEVPPDLERPNTTGALVIPEVGSPARAAAADSTASVDRVPAMGAAMGSGTADGFSVADSVESTWSRVGLALERSGIATIEARDASAHSYSIRASGKTTKPAGLLKRMVTFGKGSGKQVSSSEPLTVRIVEEADGSRVKVEGGSSEANRDAARKVIDVLRQRLS